MGAKHEADLVTMAAIFEVATMVLEGGGGVGVCDVIPESGGRHGRPGSLSKVVPACSMEALRCFFTPVGVAKSWSCRFESLNSLLVHESVAAFAPVVSNLRIAGLKPEIVSGEGQSAWEG